MNRKPVQLGQILLNKGLITLPQLKEALAEQKITREFLGEILLKKSLIKESDILKALSEQFNISFLSVKDKYIDWEFVKGFSSSLILDYRCFPVDKDETFVTFAITNPLDAWVIKKAEEEAGLLKPKFILILKSEMGELINAYQQYMRGGISKYFK